MGKLSKTLVDYNENDQSWSQVKHVLHSHTQLNFVQKAYKWEDGLPGPIYEAIFSYLEFHDLRSCRYTCRDWNFHCTPFFNEKSTIVFKGSIGVRTWRKAASKICPAVTTPDKRFVSIIRGNPTWLKTWPNLGIENANKKDFSSLITSLTPEIKQLAYNHISKLELKRCKLSWNQYTSLLKELPSLTAFTDVNTFISFDESWSIFCKTPAELEDFIVEKYAKASLNIKRLKIHRPSARFKTLLLIKVLNSFEFEGIESFEFKVQNVRNSGGFGNSIDYASMLGLFLLKHLASLQELSFEWGGERCLFYLDDLYKIIRILTFYSTPLLITKLNLHFDYLFLGNNTFQEVLVPFVQSLRHLKSFSLKKIILQPEWIGLLLMARPNNYEELETEINLGILLSDHPTREFAHENVHAILSSPTIQDRIVSFRIAVSSEETEEIREILPMDGFATFSRVQELLINRMDFKTGEIALIERKKGGLISYNIDLICYTFENLTVLSITDARNVPSYYSSRFRAKNKMDRGASSATLGDREMQLIIRCLAKLQKLRLRMSLEYLSDVGMTGLDQETCEMMKLSKDFIGPKPETSRVGLQLSNLQDLEEVVLRGVFHHISDVTAFQAFDGLKKLKIIGIFGDHDISSVELGYKECLPDGTWFKHPISNQTWSNYTTCVDPDEFQWRRFIVSFHEWGYIISIVALISSLLIFCCFKCLECTRVRIHKNLFVSFIINNILWLFWYRAVTANEYTLLREPWWCKGLHVLVQYFLMANYFWMLCEGIYLHTLLVFTFIRSDSSLLKLLYVVGWLGPLIPIIIYTAFRMLNSHEDSSPCWTTETTTSGLWLAIPVCLSLIANLCFLINILRVIVTKLKESRRSFTHVQRRNSSINAPDSQYSLRKAARATLILIPLLGLHYLLLPIRPPKGTYWEIVYDIISAAASSLQGLCVSFLFCFCNAEVLTVFKRKILFRFRRDGSSPGHRDDQHSGPIPTSMSVHLKTPL